MNNENDNLEVELMAIVGMDSSIDKERRIKELAKNRGVGVQFIKKEIHRIDKKIQKRDFEVAVKNEYTTEFILDNGLEATVPHPFLIKDFKIYKEKIIRGKDGEHIVIEKKFNAIIYVSALTKNCQTGEEGAQITYICNGQAPRKAVVRWTILNSASKILELGSLGIPINSNNSHDAIDIIETFTEENREKIPLIKVVDSFGLHFIDGEWHFIYGNKIISSNSSSKNKIEKNSDSLISISSKAMHVKGNSEQWIEAMKFFLKHDLALFIFGAVLAAPFMKFFSLSPFLIHVHGNSSQGKSTILKVASSFCGDIGDEGLVLSWNCSLTGAEARLADFNGASPIFDDLSQARGDDVVKSIVYMIGNARGAQRGTITGGSQKISTFTGIALSSGEGPIVKNATLQGMAIRVLELDELPFGERLTGEEIHQLNKYSEVILNNYGHFYEPFLQQIVDDLNNEVEREKLQDHFNDISNEMKNKKEGNNFSNRILPSFAVIKFALRRVKNLIPELELTDQKINESVDRLFVSRLEKLDAKNNIDYKALQYVFDRVIASPRAFQDDNDQLNQWGKYIYPANNRKEIEAYAILRPRLHELLKEGGFDPESMINFFKNNKWYENDKSGGLKTIAFSGRPPARCFVFKIELLKKLGIVGKEEKEE